MSDGKTEMFFSRCQDQLRFPPEAPLQGAGRILKPHLVKKTRVRSATDGLHLPPECFIKYRLINNFYLLIIIIITVFIIVVACFFVNLFEKR
jgi:hypothetical protein